MITLVPLEPIEQRYTAQWYEWVPEVFDSVEACEEVLGEEMDSDLQGEYFLDPIATNVWGLTQVAALIRRLETIGEDEDHTIFFYDLWHPGIEALQYVRDMTDMEFQIAGVLHAGSYDPWDLTAQNGMDRWAGHIENGWFQFIDQVFVATEFHRDFVCVRRDLDREKVAVTGLPVDVEGLQQFRTPWDEREDRVVFTGRLSEEKGWPRVQEMLEYAEEREYDIHVTHEHQHPKQEYYEILGNSKAVFAPSKQETFGYGVIEGMALGCQPVVPDKLAFVETVPQEFRYEDYEAATMDQIFQSILDDGKFFDPVDSARKYQYQDVIMRMWREL